MPFFVVLIIIIGSGIVLDQITKILIHSLMEVGDSVSVIPHVLNFTYVRNEGMAFGLLSEHRWIFMTVSAIAITVMCLYLFRWCKESKLIKIGIAVVISGGVGNMIDRIFRGFVVDMIDCQFINFYVFNVADSCVCVGAGIAILGLIIELVNDYKSKRAKNDDNGGAENENK